MLFLGSREMVPRTKFFYLFFNMSWPGLARNEDKTTFFFYYFLGNPPTRVMYRRYWKRNFFSHFVSLSWLGLSRKVGRIMFF